MNKAGEAIILTDREIETICEKAAETGVQKYIDALEEHKKQKKSSLLYNTIILLENYRMLKSYAEKATSKLEDIAVNGDDVTLEVLEIFGLRSNDRKNYSIARGVSNVKIVLNHIDNMLDVYKRECMASASTTVQRRWVVLDKMYISGDENGKKMNTTAIADELGLDLRVIQEDAKHAREDMKTLIFGIDGLISEFEYY